MASPTELKITLHQKVLKTGITKGGGIVLLEGSEESSGSRHLPKRAQRVSPAGLPAALSHLISFWL